MTKVKGLDAMLGLILAAGVVSPTVHAFAGFNQIDFNITTGGDDLRKDSDAKAVVHFRAGGMETFILKARDAGSWDNNSNHVKTFPLGVPRIPADITSIDITLTSHNGTFETDDNWNIQDIVVTLVGTGKETGSACVFKGSGDPFHRLTGSAGTVTLTPTQGCK